MPTKDSSGRNCPKCGALAVRVIKSTERPAAGFLSDGTIQVVTTCECEKCGAVFSEVKAKPFA